MPFIGNTIRLVVKFKDFDQEYADPDEIILRFYDHRRNQIGGDITLNLVTDKIDTGIYQYTYTIPDTVSRSIIFEFTGDLDGTPSIGRGEIPLRWA